MYRGISKHVCTNRLWYNCRKMTVKFLEDTSSDYDESLLAEEIINVASAFTDMG